MMTTPCVLFVHAHPDDEASSTGVTIATLHAQGVRTVLVTCTGGELGDSPSGVTPDHDDHDTEEVAQHRLDELRTACTILGIDRLELLGYHDSGMMGWDSNKRADCFWQASIPEAAQRLADIMRQEQPVAVVTYDEKGFYGHPDHIQANRVTRAALELLDEAPALYYPILPLSRARAFAAMAPPEGMEGEGPNLEELEAMATPDEEVVVVIDGRDVVGLKRSALLAHQSQTGTSFFATMPEELFGQVFGVEAYAQPGHRDEPVRHSLF
jgi:LmbE family N-acetylglucosaminyl deacetylase